MSGHEEEAIRLQRENLAVREASLGKSHPHTLLSLHNLGLAYRSTHHPKEAISTLETWLKTDPCALAGAMAEVAPSAGESLAAAMRCFINSIRPRHVTCALWQVVEARRNEESQKIRILEYLTSLYTLKGESGIDNAKKYGDRCAKLCQEHYGPEHSRDG